MFFVWHIYVTFWFLKHFSLLFFIICFSVWKKWCSRFKNAFSFFINLSVPVILFFFFFLLHEGVENKKINSLFLLLLVCHCKINNLFWNAFLSQKMYLVLSILYFYSKFSYNKYQEKLLHNFGIFFIWYMRTLLEYIKFHFTLS